MTFHYLGNSISNSSTMSHLVIQTLLLGFGKRRKESSKTGAELATKYVKGQEASKCRLVFEWHPVAITFI